MTFTTDPQYLLDSLADSLDTYGGIKSVVHSSKFLAALQKSDKLVSKCTYLNILRSTSCEEARLQILSSGAWNLLYDWLKEAETQSTWGLVKELLNTFIEFPLTIDLLRLNNTPKIIRRLSKRLDVDSEIRRLAADIVFIWKDLIIDESVLQSNHNIENAFNSKNIKNRTNTLNRKSMLSEQQIQQQMMQANMSIDPNIDLEEEHDDYSSGGNSSNGSDVIVEEDADYDDVDGERSRVGAATTKGSLKSYSPPRALKLLHKPPISSSPGNLFEKLKPARQQKVDKKSSNFVGDALKKRDDSVKSTSSSMGSTAKTFSSKFKSTGLDSEPEPPLKKFKIPKTSNAGKVGLEATPISAYYNNQPSNPVHSNHLTKPTAHPHAGQSSTKDQRRNSGGSGVTLGSAPLQQQSAKPTPAVTSLKQQSVAQVATKQPHDLHVSSMTSSSAYNKPSVIPSLEVSRKTPPAAAPHRLPPLLTSSSENNTAVTSTSPTTPPIAGLAKSKQQTSVKPIQLMESDIFMAALEGNAAQKQPLIRKKKIVPKPISGHVTGPASTAPNSLAPSASFYRESMRATGSNISGQSFADQSASDQEPTNGAKVLKWAKEPDLVQIRYFEVDECERANVNRMKMHGDYKHFEMHRERELMEAAKRGQFESSNEESFARYRFEPFEGCIQLTERGCKSSERKVQAERQQTILTEVFLPGMPLPETPKEPELIDRTAQHEPFVIPLDDMSNNHLTAQLPPELNKLLEGLKQSGMMPSVPNPSTGFVPQTSLLTPGATTAGGMAASAIPNLMMPSNLPVLPTISGQSGMNPQQLALFQQLTSLPPQQQQILQQQTVNASVGQPPLQQLQQQPPAVPLMSLPPPMSFSVPVTTRPAFMSGVPPSAPVFTGGPGPGVPFTGQRAATVNAGPAGSFAGFGPGPANVPRMADPSPFAGGPQMANFGGSGMQPQENRDGSYNPRFDDRRGLREDRDRQPYFRRERDDPSDFSNRRSNPGIGPRFDGHAPRFSGPRRGTPLYNRVEIDPRPCRDFLWKGQCSFGAACKFSHDPASRDHADGFRGSRDHPTDRFRGFRGGGGFRDSSADYRRSRDRDGKPFIPVPSGRSAATSATGQPTTVDPPAAIAAPPPVTTDPPSNV